MAGASVLTDELRVPFGQPVDNESDEHRPLEAAVLSTLPPAASTDAVMMVP